MGNHISKPLKHLLQVLPTTSIINWTTPLNNQYTANFFFCILEGKSSCSSEYPQWCWYEPPSLHQETWQSTQQLNNSMILEIRTSSSSWVTYSLLPIQPPFIYSNLCNVRFFGYLYFSSYNVFIFTDYLSVLWPPHCHLNSFSHEWGLSKA